MLIFLLLLKSCICICNGLIIVLCFRFKLIKVVLKWLINLEYLFCGLMIYILLLCVKWFKMVFLILVDLFLFDELIVNIL